MYTHGKYVVIEGSSYVTHEAVPLLINNKLIFNNYLIFFRPFIYN